MASIIDGHGGVSLPPISAPSPTSASNPTEAGDPNWFSPASMDATSRQTITAAPGLAADTPLSVLSHQISTHIGENSDL